MKRNIGALFISLFSLLLVVSMLRATGGKVAYWKFDEGFGDEAVGEAKERAFLTDKENAELVNAVLNIVEKYKKEDIDAAAGLLNVQEPAQVNPNEQKIKSEGRTGCHANEKAPVSSEATHT